MSNITIASLQRITPPRLYSLLKQREGDASSVAVVDVRDSDYFGGHIRNCVHTPSSNLDWKLPELIRTLEDKDVVVFHCMLSQQRGPMAGLRYLRERERVQSAKAGGGEENPNKGTEEADGNSNVNLNKEKRKQDVYVLEGGFQKWQEQYGEDDTVTEGYLKDLWEDGFMD